MSHQKYRIHGKTQLEHSALPETHSNGKKYKSRVSIKYRLHNHRRDAIIYFVEATPLPPSTIDSDGNIEMFVLKTSFDLFLENWQAMRPTYIHYEDDLVPLEGFSIIGTI